VLDVRIHVQGVNLQSRNVLHKKQQAKTIEGLIIFPSGLDSPLGLDKVEIVEHGVWVTYVIKSLL